MRGLRARAQGAKITAVEGPQLSAMLEGVGRAFVAFDEASRAADSGGLVSSGASGAGGARERDRCWGKVRLLRRCPSGANCDVQQVLLSLLRALKHVAGRDLYDADGGMLAGTSRHSVCPCRADVTVVCQAR